MDDFASETAWIEGNNYQGPDCTETQNYRTMTHGENNVGGLSQDLR